VYLSSVLYLYTIKATTPPGLHFILGGRLLTGNEVNITNIGGQPTTRSDPGSTLVCLTDNVNRNCCRNGDTGNSRLGGWYHNNTLVMTLSNASTGGSNNVFVSVAYTRQVRLTAIGHPTTPIGVYTCRVPNENGIMIEASITLINVVAGK